VNKSRLAILLLFAAVAAAQTKPAHPATHKPETPHLQFVKEYVRELIEDEDLKTNAEKELQEAQTLNGKFSAGIYISKSTQLALRSQIGVLKNMHLKDPFDDVIPTLIAFNQRQIDLHQKLIEISSKLLTRPKPGVDYEGMAAKVPEIRAEMDNVRKALFDAAPLVFMSLVDMRPDSQNHVNHLIITKVDKADLQDQLSILLKDVPEKGDHDYYISAAMILRGGFQKDYKCADDPWE
jgi:hypothetical protein